MSHPENIKSSSTRLIFSLLFVAVLLMPALLGLIGHKSDAGKHAKQMDWPGLQKDALLQADYYKAWVQYARGRLTSAGPLSKAKNWIDFRVFAMTETEGVHVGSHGWLFDQASVRDYRKSGCQNASTIARLILSLRAAQQIIEASGRRFIFTVAPGKSTIYPEFMGAVPRDSDCGRSPYDILKDTLEKEPLASFVRLDDALLDAKAAQRLLYNPAGTHWNADGARVAAHMMMQRLTGGPLFEPPTDTDDLTSVLMTPGPKPTIAQPGLAAGHPQQHASAVIYGGQALNHLMPRLLPRFRRIDVMSSTHLPTMQHGENLAAYDTIMVAVSETQLCDLEINLDHMGQHLNAGVTAATRRPIALDAITAGSKVAFDEQTDHLVIKSTGEGAYFNLPVLSGSAADNLRVLQLDITAPRNDTLYWSSVEGAFESGAHDLRAGPNRLYVPLPRTPTLRMRIHTGRSAGLFQLYGATVLTFGEALEDAAPDNASPTMSEPAPMHQPADFIAVDAPPRMAAEPEIRLNDFETKQVFQRRGTASDIVVSGAYQGSPGAVEARVETHDTRTVIMPWTVVDRSPANGIFIGVLQGVPQGGWYRLAVRLRDQPAIQSWGEAPWGVGMLVACIGQSNMREWFHTGTDIAHHPMLSIHRDGKWIDSLSNGNGAGAFAHWLIAQLNIPIGLLDYAVNGSGLHPEADWGTGYWANHGRGSIYRRFIDGIAAAGGAVEYVIWMQGEADAARRTITGNQYLHTLTSFIERQVRQDITNGSHKANLPFLVVGMAKRPVGSDAPHQEIRRALVAASRDIDDAYLAATTLDLKTQGRQHLAPEGYTALGRRVAQTILNLLGKTNYHRGPVIDRIERIDASTIDLYMNHDGGNDFDPQENITGFKAFSGETSLAISTIERQDHRSIRIQLQQPATGQWRLTYLYGARPDTRGAVRDNSELQLPLEPFEITIK